MYRCVLAPVDGAAFGEHALPLAPTVGQGTGASLHLAHVRVPATSPPIALEAGASERPWNEVLRERERGYRRPLPTRPEAELGVET